jgi:hypothetical protein
LQDPSAWQLVMEWATHQADEFPILMAKLEKFSDHFHYKEWRDVFNTVFNASEDGTCIAMVKSAMAEKGVSFDSPSMMPSTNCKPQSTSKHPMK